MKSRKKHTGKSLTLLISLLLILGITVAGTLAYLFTTSGLLSNSFKKVAVSCAVDETFLNDAKEKIAVDNNGQIDAYIRVAIVPTWEDDNQHAVNLNASTGDFYGIQDGNINNGWQKIGDYYYCTTKIAPGKSTPPLFKNPVYVNKDSKGYLAGYHMNLQVLCEAIQDVPDNAVADAWNDVSVNEGKLEAVK